MKTDRYAIRYETITLTNDYTGDTNYAAMGLFFGVVLVAAATLKVINSDDTESTLALPAGFHPMQLKKIYKNGDGTNVASVVIFY